MAWSEDRIHRWLLSLHAPRGLAGSRGHDAAVIVRLPGRPVVCVDQTVEGVHFERGTDPRLVGRKAAARALSDLAATAAEPRGLLLALTASASRPEAWIQAVIASVRATGRRHGAELYGGDLCAARGPAHLSVSALGAFRGPGRPPGRDRARAGQVLVLTGPVGGSLLGRHLTFAPRIAEGRRLHLQGATAMMDISDGLAWDLHRLARLSGVRIDLDLERVPVHADARALSKRSGRPAIWHALHDGEDHELVATIDARGAARSGFPAIGRVRRGAGSGSATRTAGRAAGARPRAVSSMDVERSRTLLSRSPEATRALGEALGRAVPADTVLALGDLGSGKTCFVQGLARGLDVRDPVTSPTYALLQTYSGRLELYHFDAWMEGRERAFLQDGGIEWMRSGGVAAIEWAERVDEVLPSPRLEIGFEHAGETARRLTVAVVGAGAAADRLWDLVQGLEPQTDRDDAR